MLIRATTPSRSLSTVVILAFVLVVGLGPAASRAADDLYDENSFGAPAPSDPLRPFNHGVLTFNRKLDAWALRPVASAWAWAIPEGGRRSLGRAFDNLGFPQRFANNLFRARFGGAGRELGRFVINSTVGGAGLFDPAQRWLGWGPSGGDFGLTLGSYGVGQGPYLMLPFLGPSSVRDAFGRAVDTAMNPLDYLVTGTLVVAIEAGVAVGDAVNTRSMSLDLFEDADRDTLDLYSAIRDLYLQRRERELQE
ncbi:MAG: VacJ family lipoprotein [Myxococcota bacterium]